MPPTIGVCASIGPTGVAPGVAPNAPTGVAPPTPAGVSSQRDLGPAAAPILASAPGTIPGAGVLSHAFAPARPGVGVSSHRFLVREGVALGSPTRPGVGVA